MVDTHFFVRRCQLPWALFFRSALDVLTLRQALAEVRIVLRALLKPLLGFKDERYCGACWCRCCSRIL
jgi:hypothetical protein